MWACCVGMVLDCAARAQRQELQGTLGVATARASTIPSQTAVLPSQFTHRDPGLFSTLALESTPSAFAIILTRPQRRADANAPFRVLDLPPELLENVFE